VKNYPRRGENRQKNLLGIKHFKKQYGFIGKF